MSRRRSLLKMRGNGVTDTGERYQRLPQYALKPNEFINLGVLADGVGNVIDRPSTDIQGVNLYLTASITIAFASTSSLNDIGNGIVVTNNNRFFTFTSSQIKYSASTAGDTTLTSLSEDISAFKVGENPIVLFTQEYALSLSDNGYNHNNAIWWGNKNTNTHKYRWNSTSVANNQPYDFVNKEFIIGSCGAAGSNYSSVTVPITSIRYNGTKNGLFYPGNLPEQPTSKPSIALYPYLDTWYDEVVFSDENFEHIYHISEYLETLSINADQYVDLGILNRSGEYILAKSDDTKYQVYGHVGIIYDNTKTYDDIDGVVLSLGNDKFTFDSSKIYKNNAAITPQNYHNDDGYNFEIQQSASTSGINYDNAIWFNMRSSATANHKYSWHTANNQPYSMINNNIYIGSKTGGSCTCPISHLRIINVNDDILKGNGGENEPYTIRYFYAYKLYLGENATKYVTCFANRNNMINEYYKISGSTRMDSIALQPNQYIEIGEITGSYYDENEETWSNFNANLCVTFDENSTYASIGDKDIYSDTYSNYGRKIQMKSTDKTVLLRDSNGTGALQEYEKLQTGTPNFYSNINPNNLPGLMLSCSYLNSKKWTTFHWWPEKNTIYDNSNSGSGAWLETNHIRIGSVYGNSVTAPITNIYIRQYTDIGDEELRILYPYLINNVDVFATSDLAYIYPITTVNVNANGTSSVVSTQLDENGNAITTTYNYDQNGDLSTSSTAVQDDQGNVNTQTLDYINGEPEVIQYIIDTSGNTSGSGELIDESIDTGFVAFSGRSFEVTADIEFSCEEQGTGKYKSICAAIEPTGHGNKYRGFYIRNISTYKIGMYGSNEGLNLNSNGTGGNSIGDQITILKARQRYQLVIRYNPGTGGGNIYFSITPTSTNGTTVSENEGLISMYSSSLPPTMDNATFIIGGNGINPTNDAVNLVVYSLNVCKTS